MVQKRSADDPNSQEASKKLSGTKPKILKIRIFNFYSTML